jgi:hypothetical protein
VAKWLESQLSRMNCQMFSTGLSAGRVRRLAQRPVSLFFCPTWLRGQTRPLSRQARLATKGLFGDLELLSRPLAQIDHPPAHGPLDGRDRPALRSPPTPHDASRSIEVSAQAPCGRSARPALPAAFPSQSVPHVVLRDAPCVAPVASNSGRPRLARPIRCRPSSDWSIRCQESMPDAVYPSH